MIRASFLLAVVAVLIAAARSFLPEDATQAAVGSGGALAFGFVLLAAMQAGTIFGGVRLPRLTGYLACGFLAGPSVLNFVTEDMVKDLKPAEIADFQNLVDQATAYGLVKSKVDVKTMLKTY